MEIKLSKADLMAIDTQDSNYLNSKGAKYYSEQNYEHAVEYYRLASSMGNAQATSNLGYCYLYGRSIPVNVNLAIQYFKLAAKKEVIDAIYKLGDIYSRDKWVEPDRELAAYYYLKGLEYFGRDSWELYYSQEARRYPSLFFAIGRESMLNGILNPDLDFAYLCLKIAEEGYKKYIGDGDSMYQESYDNVLKLLEDESLNDAKERYNQEYNSSKYDDEHDEED